MRIGISSCVAQVIRQAAADAYPREACGLLFGTDGHLDLATSVSNISDNPETRFEIDPTALFAALRAERAGGPRLIGYWHSHPSGDPAPSVTDAAMAEPDGKLWLLFGDGELRGWRAGTDGLHGRFAPIELTEMTDPDG